MMRIANISIYLLLFIIFFAISIPYYSGDVKNHVVWGESLLYLGPDNFFYRDFPGFAFPNYPPLANVVFALSVLLYDVTYSLAWTLNTTLQIFPSNIIPFLEWENVKYAFLKLPAILTALATLFIINKIITENFKGKHSWWLSIVTFGINPVIIYDSVIWGQFEFLPIFFILLAFYLAFNKQLYWAFFFSALALLSKQTVIIFWAIFVLWCFLKFPLKKNLTGLVIALITFYASYIPFHLQSLTWPFELYKLNFSYVAFSTNENTFNLWGFLDNFQRRDDTQTFLFTSLHNWGYLLFGIFFLPLIYLFYKNPTKENLFKLLYLTTILFFFFLTRMHERYIAPASAFLPIIVGFDKKYVISLVFFSVLIFLNLYRGLTQPDIKLLTDLVFNLTFIKMLVAGYLLFILYNIYLYISDH